MTYEPLRKSRRSKRKLGKKILGWGGAVLVAGALTATGVVGNYVNANNQTGLERIAQDIAGESVINRTIDIADDIKTGIDTIVKGDRENIVDALYSRFGAGPKNENQEQVVLPGREPDIQNTPVPTPEMVSTNYKIGITEIQNDAITINSSQIGKIEEEIMIADRYLMLIKGGVEPENYDFKKTLEVFTKSALDSFKINPYAMAIDNLAKALAQGDVITTYETGSEITLHDIMNDESIHLEKDAQVVSDGIALEIRPQVPAVPEISGYREIRTEVKGEIDATCDHKLDGDEKISTNEALGTLLLNNPDAKLDIDLETHIYESVTLDVKLPPPGETIVYEVGETGFLYNIDAVNTIIADDGTLAFIADTMGLRDALNQTSDEIVQEFRYGIYGVQQWTEDPQLAGYPAAQLAGLPEDKVTDYGRPSNTFVTTWKGISTEAATDAYMAQLETILGVVNAYGNTLTDTKDVSIEDQSKTRYENDVMWDGSSITINISCPEVYAASLENKVNKMDLKVYCAQVAQNSGLENDSNLEININVVPYQ